MTKLITKGFTNYFGDVIEICIIGYDNDKYVEIAKPNGAFEKIKRGYVWRDALMTRRIPGVDWFVHGGGDRRDFSQRRRKTMYSVDGVEPVGRRDFTSKSKAINYASAAAVRTGQVVNVWGSRKSALTYESGFVNIDCTPAGFAVQYGSGRRSRAKAPKYLYGYGRR